MALIALGVTGGIGAYKAVEVARGLQKRGHEVVAVMTRSATRFVGPVTFEAITRRPRHHRSVRRRARTPTSSTSRSPSTIDLLLVAPATANIIGKFANGIADDFLSTLYTATRAPVLLAPAMNTQHVRARGGAAEPRRRWRRAACGSSSRARAIWRAAGSARAGWPSRRRSSPRPSAMLRPTRSAARPARAGHRRADLRRHRSGAVRRQPIERPHGLRARRGGRAPRRRGDAGRRADARSSRRRSREVVRVRSAAEMHAGGDARAPTDADVVVMAAAVADYTPARARRRRRSRRATRPLTLVLKRTPDILGDLGAAPAGVGRRTGAGRLRRRDRATSCARGRAKRERKARRPDRRQRRVARRRRLRRRHQRGDDRRRRRRRERCRCRARRASPPAILDRVEAAARGAARVDADVRTIADGSRRSSTEHLRVLRGARRRPAISRDPDVAQRARR